ncbi:FUSC family protein [Agromyces sp. GXS1127]|uniref:FUSC family protein n=1 Tax=Agromyces sp. GXS1127 TaxID=3424181 RepID=UPI003D3109E8
MFRQLVAIDRSKLRWGLAALALVAIVVCVALEALTGVGFVQTSIAAVLVVLTGGKGTLGSRFAYMAIVTVFGGVLGFLAYVTAENAWAAALVLAVAAYLTGLAYGISRAAGSAGYLLLCWVLVVLIGQSRDEYPGATSVAFLIGGAIAMALVGIVALVTRGRAFPAPLEEPVANAGAGGKATFGSLVTSDLGIWNLVRAVLIVFAVVIGYSLTTDLDPYWAAIVLLIVFLPDLGKTMFKAIQRGVGTIVGVLTATGLIAAFDADPPMIVVMIIGAFGAVAFYSANYMIYAFFLTNAVLSYYWLAVDHEMSGPGIRIVDTLIGIALAIGGVAIVTLITKRRHAQIAAPHGGTGSTSSQQATSADD